MFDFQLRYVIECHDYFLVCLQILDVKIGQWMISEKSN